MPTLRPLALAAALLVTAAAIAAEPSPPATPPAGKGAAKPQTMQQLLAATKPDEWRTLDPEHTLYLELTTGRVVIELAPLFAPRHVTNIEKLAHAHWYDGLAITRVQDNFVAQWGDPLSGKPDVGEKKLPAEFTRPAGAPNFVRLKEPDTFAPEVGFSGDFPVARASADGEAWLAHCYAMVGVGRDNDPSTAIGTELYAVIGHAPRQLDRNVALVGRVVFGIELLSSLPRGTAELGFYEQPEQRVPIQTVRVAADVGSADRSRLEVLKTESPTFQKLIEMRRNRKDPWFKYQAGHIDLCNVPIPVRERPEPRKKG